MQRLVNPMIDSAFKALFANPHHSHLLVDLLNAVIQPAIPILSVEYLDPVDGPDRLEGRGTSVDVKVKDSLGRRYQIEVQVVLHPAFAERIALTWSRMYDRQLDRGDGFDKLVPVTAVWILERRFGPDDRLHRHYALRDRQGGLLTDHCNIHVLELANLPPPDLEDPMETWLYFLKEARDWQNLPPGLDRSPFTEAMQIMKRFAQDDAQYYRYMAELDAEAEKLTFDNAREKYERQMADFERQKEKYARQTEEMAQMQQALTTVQEEKERAQAEKERAQAEKERAQAEKERAQEEKERAQEEKERAQEEKERAQEEKERAQEEKERAQEEKERAQASENKALRELAGQEAEVARLRALLDPSSD